MGLEDMPPETYSVGYGKPPREHQFKKGQPPPPRRARAKTFNPQRIWDDPLEVQRNGRSERIHPYEARLFSLAKGALNGNVANIEYLLKEFIARGVFDRPADNPLHQCPNNIPFAVFCILAPEYGQPPYTKPQIRK